MKAILLGNKKLYDRLCGPPTDGFQKLTTRRGTPILYLSGIPTNRIWHVTIESQPELLGDEFGYVTVDDFLEEL